jgi:hypothetical protein
MSVEEEVRRRSSRRARGNGGPYSKYFDAMCSVSVRGAPARWRSRGRGGTWCRTWTSSSGTITPHPAPACVGIPYGAQPAVGNAPRRPHIGAAPEVQGRADEEATDLGARRPRGSERKIPMVQAPTPQMMTSLAPPYSLLNMSSSQRATRRRAAPLSFFRSRRHTREPWTPRARPAADRRHPRGPAEVRRAGALDRELHGPRLSRRAPQPRESRGGCVGSAGE